MQSQTKGKKNADTIIRIGGIYEVLTQYTYCAIGGANKRYLKLIEKYGTRCGICGAEGTFFGVAVRKPSKNQTTSNQYFRLYRYDEQGDMVEMTIDHIVPLSKGGRNAMLNLQITCMTCNHFKGNTLPHDYVDNDIRSTAALSGQALPR